MPTISAASIVLCLLLVLVAPMPSPGGGAFAAPVLPRAAPLPSPSPHSPDISPEPVPGTGHTPPIPEARPKQSLESPRRRIDMPPGVVAPTPEELACRARLRTLGVIFAEHAPLADPVGCSASHPVTVTRLSKTVSIEPEAVLSCAMAETMARFTANVIAPAARSDFGSPLQSIHHASAYVCRTRNGSTKLSEHAFANALDIASFVLDDGQTIAVKATEEPRQADFLARIRMAACGPFKTVLGPGADSDHKLHFHFDLAKRRNGSTYCR